MTRLFLTEEEYQHLCARTKGRIENTPPFGTNLPNKYGARKESAYGMKFDSAGEARRYGELVVQEGAGLISELRRQVKYQLHVNRIPVTTWRCDFSYRENGVRIIEDYKGYRTNEYKIKRNLFQAISGVKVRETTKSDLRRVR